MLIDMREVADGRSLVATVCIIGAGVAGITLARELEKQGIDTCVLESGGLVADDATRDLARGEATGFDYQFADGCRGRFLGGSSNCWGGWPQVDEENTHRVAISSSVVSAGCRRQVPSANGRSITLQSSTTRTSAVAFMSIVRCSVTQTGLFREPAVGLLGMRGGARRKEVAIGAQDAFAQADGRRPAEASELAGIQQLAWRAIRLAGIKAQLALKADDACDQLRQIGNADLFAAANIQVRALRREQRMQQPAIQLHQVQAGGRKIIDMQEFAQRTPTAPHHHLGRTGLMRLVDLPQECRQHMAAFQVEVVAGAIEIGRHQAPVVATVLPVIAFAQLDAGNLGHGVGSLVGSSVPVSSASSAMGCAASLG